MQQLQSNPSAAADPAHLGPQILSTPMPENEVPQLITTPLPEIAKPTILGTPDDRDRLAGLFDQPGYEPTGIGHDTLQESFPIHDHDWKDSVLLKDYPDTVEKINGRYPINGDLAGTKYPLSEELQVLYPEGVWFKENGNPDFAPHAEITVQVEGLTGDRKQDAKKANKAAGLLETPKDRTWHHVEDGITMELLPKKLHHGIKHTGGAAKIKELNKR